MIRPRRCCEQPTPSRTVQHIPHLVWSLLAVLYGPLPVLAQTPNTPQAELSRASAPSATISGQAIVVGNKRRPAMIVYLEPTGTKQAFPRPTESKDPSPESGRPTCSPDTS